VGPITIEYVPGSKPRGDLTEMDDLLGGLLLDEPNSITSFFKRA
jgi:hypothetical protein